jgi:hypothetical protein
MIHLCPDLAKGKIVRYCGFLKGITEGGLAKTLYFPMTSTPKPVSPTTMFVDV